MSAKECIKDGWFYEAETLWPGQRFGLKVEKVLVDEPSEFQHVLLFKSTNYGHVLALDGNYQVTERDEFAYQEMMTHVALYAHPNPKKVLIVGGGDGGCLREICKHDCVTEIDFCEIDPKVCEVSKKYLKDLSSKFDDPRCNLVHADAAVFIKDKKKKYDVIVCDTSDPVGPAKSLFESAFYEDLRACLNDGGLICNQCECQWLHLDIIRPILDTCGKNFPVVDWGYMTIPSYPSGQLGFMICSLDNQDVRKPRRPVSDKILSQCKYYTEEMHSAAFMLPAFTMKALAPALKRGLASSSSSSEKPSRPSLLQTYLGVGIAALSIGLFTYSRMTNKS